MYNYFGDLMQTLKNTIESEIEIKKSRFISIIKNIQSIEEFNTCIEELKVKYPKATHYCYGYICGNIERFSDDGEPGGTAGAPILNVLKKENLNNICCVVIRYFGGIKLGAGGLIRAYAGSVAQAVREIGLVEIKEQVVLGITLSYSQYQEFANFLKDHQLAEQDPMFTDQVMTTIFVDKENTNSITAALVEFYNGKVIIEDQGIREVEVPLLSVEN